jgi:hypothetical protein
MKKHYLLSILVLTSTLGYGEQTKYFDTLGTTISQSDDPIRYITSRIGLTLEEVPYPWVSQSGLEPAFLEQIQAMVKGLYDQLNHIISQLDDLNYLKNSIKYYENLISSLDRESYFSVLEIIKNGNNITNNTVSYRNILVNLLVTLQAKVIEVQAMKIAELSSH